MMVDKEMNMNANEAREKFGHYYEALRTPNKKIFEWPRNGQYSVQGYRLSETLGIADTENWHFQHAPALLNHAIDYYHGCVMNRLREVRGQFKTFTGKHVANVLSARRRELLPEVRRAISELDALITQGIENPGCFVEVVNLEDELKIEPHLELGTPVYHAKANEMEIYVHNIAKLSIYDYRGTTYSADPRNMEYDFIVEMVTDGRSGLRLDADGEIALGNYYCAGFFRTRDGAENFLREAAQNQYEKIGKWL